MSISKITSAPASSRLRAGVKQTARETALEAVCQASRLARGVQPTPQATAAKEDRSPVTVADFSVQALISLALEEALPDQPILGEEDAAFLRSAAATGLREQVVERVRAFRPAAGTEQILAAIDRCSAPATGSFWALDPIDGTKGFLRGGQYAIALAWIEDGQVTLAALGCPQLPLDPGQPQGAVGCVFLAEKDQGTEIYDLHGHRHASARVTTVEDPAAGSFLESVEAAHSDHHRHARIAAQLGVQAPPVRLDSQAKYAALARGDASIYLRLPRDVHYREKIWDHAAGYLVITEAGGQVTDARGHTLDFTAGRELTRNEGIVATNRHLHAEVLAAVATVLESPEG